MDEKIRKSKGVPNSVKLGEIFPFLVGLGFTVKETVKFIGGDLQRSTGNPTEMDSLYSNLQTMFVASLPQNPTSGSRYVTDLKRSSPTEVQYRIHDAVPGYEILSPHGKDFHLLPEYPGGPVRVNPALNKWLKADPTFQQFLSGAAVTQNNPQQTLPKKQPAGDRPSQNNGTCPVCFESVAVRSGDMVLHGYRRPGSGSVSGRCFGLGYPPFEVSPEGTIAYLKEIEREKKAVAEKIRSIPQATSLPHPTFHGKIVTVDAVSPLVWAAAVEKAEHAARFEMKSWDTLEGILKERLNRRSV